MSKKMYPMVERRGPTVIVTAHSTVEAQQVATDALGTECTITQVERLRDGGVGGFFSTELVRVTAQPSRTRREHEEMDAVLASADDLVTSLRARAPHFADRLLAEWQQELEPVAAGNVQAPMAASYAPAPSPAPSAVSANHHVPAYVPPAPVLAPAAPVGHPPTGVAGGWSAECLRSLGLPDRIVDAALQMHPTTEGQWIVALMSVLREFCGGNSVISTVMIGPAAGDLARQLKLVGVMPEELSESVSSVAVVNANAGTLSAGLNGRQVHLVIGGEWQHLVGVPVHTVSAATARDLLVAVRVAVAWNASLGWSKIGDRYERIDEFCIIEALRTVLRDGERVGSR